MGKGIRITAGPVRLEAQLNDTRAAAAIWEALPITADASIWGDEIYFAVPVTEELEYGREVVEVGDLGYWPPGRAFCIFFGPTPASKGEEIRPASAVTVMGKVPGDVIELKRVVSGAPVIIEAAE